MRKFDCLALDCPLWGPHLLEASAGTGKTFSIEHIYVRLLLEAKEPPLVVEQILAVTFTKAATRELKGRIRGAIEKALSLLLEPEENMWEYLRPHRGSPESIQKLSEALSHFDACQIYTIHGFCYRMLREFAFEANLGFAVPNVEARGAPSALLKEGMIDFLQWGISPDLFCPEQLLFLLKEGNFEEIAEKILSEEGEAGKSFSALWSECKAALQRWDGPPISPSLLLEDFQAIRGNYKKKEGDFEGQVEALATLENPAALRKLVAEKGSLFQFLDPANQKVKVASPTLHYPTFFSWASHHIAPLIEQKKKGILKTLKKRWEEVARPLLSQEECWDFDQLLKQMRKGIEEPRFLDAVRGKYRAVIIDEFQDTDPLQWEIFERLFLTPSTEALYLVGDPKQSIYRFRGADVYTYLAAKGRLGEEHSYCLDTNYRSSPELVASLNALFSSPSWLRLPKLSTSLPYLPVKAGLNSSSEGGDGKGALHFFSASGEASELLPTTFLPYCAQEIGKLYPSFVSSLSSFAILIKDRFQAQIVVDYLKSVGIPAVTRSHLPLGQTAAFTALEELFEALSTPYDEGAKRAVVAGPLDGQHIPWSEWHYLLKEEGLVSFARALFSRDWDPSLEKDLSQLFELLFEWELKEEFSFEGVKKFLKELKTLAADEGGRRHLDGDLEAVQVLTTHVSKGLEFEVVFALGIAFRTPKGDEEEEREELEAEKLRQLYVALTRAKKRLYVPLPLSSSPPQGGSASPLELFAPYFSQERVKVEEVAPLKTPLPRFQFPSSLLEKAPERQIPPVTPLYLTSFTSLAQGEKEEVSLPPLPEGPSFTLQTMPRGAETGVVIHRLFETLFSAPRPIWREEAALRQTVEQLLRFTPLEPWKGALFERVQEILSLPLEGKGGQFSLSSLNPSQVAVEEEFLYNQEGYWVKGVIDLIACWEGRLYLIDWKTNWLPSYDRPSLEGAMRQHDYYLQASIYEEALRRYGSRRWEVGGSFYLFVRGGAPLYV